MKRIWRFSEARNIRRYDFEDRSSGDEGFVTVNRCTKACGWTRRFVRVPVLRKCGGDIREYPAPELSVDGSSFVAISDRWTKLSASRNVMNLCRM